MGGNAMTDVNSRQTIIATVFLALGFSLLEVGHFFRVAKPKRRRLVDRRRDRVRFLLTQFAGVDGAGRASTILGFFR